MVCDIRFIVVDNRLFVSGMPENTGGKETTRKGYKIPSEGLAALFKEYFNRCWGENMEYEEYLREAIRHTGALPGTLASGLRIDKEEQV